MTSNSYSILVVDDDNLILETLALLLERNGHRVTKAKNGSEAARAIDAGSFDLLLTDVLFPGRHGIEALIELSKRKAPVRIIAMSGGGKFAPEYYLALTKKFGVHAVLMKPFAERELLTAIEEVFSATRPPPPVAMTPPLPGIGSACHGIGQ